MTTTSTISPAPPTLDTTDATDDRPRYTKGAARREAILAAAEQLFAEVGYNQPTMIDVADRCQISRGGLLRYFPTKEALLVAVLDERGLAGHGRRSRPTPAEETANKTADAPAQVPDLWALWRDKGAAVDELLERRVAEVGLGQALLELMAAHLADHAYLELYVALSGEATNPSHPAHAYFADHYQGVVNWLDAQLEEAATHDRSGLLPLGSDPAAVRQLSNTIVAVMDGLQARHLYDPTFDAVEALHTYLRRAGLVLAAPGRQ